MRNYEKYGKFIVEHFPKTYFLNYDERDRKELFEIIDESILLIDCVIDVIGVKKFQQIIMSDIREQLIKVLYILPTNDDYSYHSLLRAISEKFLRLYLSTQIEIEESKLRVIGFSILKDKIKSTQDYVKFKKQIDVLFSNFGRHSEIIHGKKVKQEPIVSYLVDFMTKPADTNLKKKNRELRKYIDIITELLYPILRATTSTIETGKLAKLERAFSQKKYESLVNLK